MRIAFFLLLLLNLTFFVWAQGYLGGGEGSGEPRRLADQLEADKLRVVARGAPPEVAACRQVAGLSGEQAERLRAALEGTGLKAEIDAVKETDYWVHIPPLASKAAAEKKLAELAKLGIADAAIVEEEGVARHAVSLGHFSAEAAAHEHLQGLAKKGVKSARVETREGGSKQAGLRVRGAADMLAKRLAEMLAGIPGATAGDCPGR